MNSLKYEKAVNIITKNILTPIIYMIEDDLGIGFLCFCDTKIKMKEIYSAQEQLEKLLRRSVQITDLRDFSPVERMEIIHKAKIIHCESELVRELFEVSAVEDYRQASYKRMEITDRDNVCGNTYLN